MRNYFRLAIGVLLMMGGCSFTTDYFSESKQAELDLKVDHYEQLVKSSVEATAVLDSVYKETTMKLMGVPITTYETKYFFNVDDKMYTGIYNPTSPPTIPMITIKYLAADPSINSNDPQHELDLLKDRKVSKSSLYIGLVFLALGGGMVYLNFAAIRQQRRMEEIETQRSIDEFNKSKGIS